jgi:hypothetical protein
MPGILKMSLRLTVKKLYCLLERRFMSGILETPLRLTV